jgi:protein involved in polysaccharide export with SLBB domain
MAVHCTIQLRRFRKVLALGVAFAVGWTSLASAENGELAPQTKLRLTVVQWMPTKGEYQQWGALGGEFIVSQAGTVLLPVIGSIPVGNLSTGGLAEEIATRLQSKIGLVNKPDTTVEIVEYPPVYVVGDVTKPGQYQFRLGMTVLQALALSGGELRSDAHSQDEIKLVGELKGVDDDILRCMARIARLEAEMSGTTEIKFPQPPLGNSESRAAAEIFGQEKIIFSARANALDRQTKSLSELRDLLDAEINVLQEKIKGADLNIKSAEDELVGVKVLVDKGVAIVSRRSDLERALAGFRADRLDQVTAIMRARQGITEATRSLEGLRDQQQTDVATELQKEQANLDQLRLKRDVAQRLLLDTLASASNAPRPGEPTLIEFSVTRQDGSGEPKQIQVSEATTLLPGDVLKVTYNKQAPASSEPAAASVNAPSANDTKSEQARSQ